MSCMNNDFIRPLATTHSEGLVRGNVGTMSIFVKVFGDDWRLHSKHCNAATYSVRRIVSLPNGKVSATAPARTIVGRVAHS
ncbi:hypothetical protein PTI98_002477 [Pleurotus ostreatus]|nr:hypothetical protein PTI98_002477 [Pleurotus ostreatus]